MRQLNRIRPNMEPTDYTTYQVISPHDTAIVTACQNVGCAAWRYGWDTAIDERTEQGQAQAFYIRTQSGRTFREMPAAGGLTVFRFESGQRCFAEHSTRPEIFRQVAGDFRIAGPELRRYVRAEDWVEDFADNQDRLAERLRRG
jgi:hypothetical protein